MAIRMIESVNILTPPFIEPTAMVGAVLKTGSSHDYSFKLLEAEASRHQSIFLRIPGQPVSLAQPYRNPNLALDPRPPHIHLSKT
jgi:hypothetical protein